MTRSTAWTWYTADAPPAAALTHWHRDVVTLAMCGFGCAEIARSLSLPEHEVRWLLREAAEAAAVQRT